MEKKRNEILPLTESYISFIEGENTVELYYEDANRQSQSQKETVLVDTKVPNVVMLDIVKKPNVLFVTFSVDEFVRGLSVNGELAMLGEFPNDDGTYNFFYREEANDGQLSEKVIVEAMDEAGNTAQEYIE